MSKANATIMELENVQKLWLYGSLFLLAISVAFTVAWAVTSNSVSEDCLSKPGISGEFKGGMSLSNEAWWTFGFDLATIVFSIIWYKLKPGAKGKHAVAWRSVQIGLITLAGAVAITFRANSLRVYNASFRDIADSCGGGNFLNNISAWLTVASLAVYAVAVLGLHTIPKEEPITTRASSMLIPYGNITHENDSLLSSARALRQSR
jgi:hypothetical protein